MGSVLKVKKSIDPSWLQYLAVESHQTKPIKKRETSSKSKSKGAAR